MSSTIKQSYRFEEKIETYLDTSQCDSIGVEPVGDDEVLVIRSDEDIFDELTVLGDELGSKSVSSTTGSPEYRISLE